MKNKISDITQQMAWEHYKLLAQQRIQHFNFFIIFTIALLAAYASTFSNNVQKNCIAVAIAIIEIILVFVFEKLDNRNKFMIKHIESILKESEKTLECNQTLKLFNGEEAKTNKIREEDKDRCFFVVNLVHQSCTKFYINFSSFYRYLQPLHQ